MYDGDENKDDAHQPAANNDIVHATDLRGLLSLRALGIQLLEPRSEELDLQLCTSWSSTNKLQFDDDGHVVFLDLGGQRLRRISTTAAVQPNLQCLQCFPALKTLNLGGTDVRLTSDLLSWIFFNNNDVVDCDDGEFQTPYQIHVQRLYLGGNGLGDSGMKVLAEWFKEKIPSSLSSLDLRYNDITDIGLETLCDAFLHSSSSGSNIQQLHLEGNQITLAPSPSVDNNNKKLRQHQLVEWLIDESCCSLEELYLGGNQIGPDGATQSLAVALRLNLTLSKLYLEGNHIGPNGANALTEALLENAHQGKESTTRLEHLYVDNNNIGKEASMRLARALNSNTTIPDNNI